MKKGVFFGLLLIILVFGMIFVGCETDLETKDTKMEKDKPPPKEPWSKITSLSQVNGTWKGSYSQTMPLEEFMALLGMLDQVPEVGIYVTGSLDITQIINAAAATASTEVKATLKFSHSNPLILFGAWITIKLVVIDPIIGGMEGFDVKGYPDCSVTTTVTPPLDPFGVGALSGALINQDGTEIKVSTGSLELPTELPVEIPPEIIFVKQ